MKGGGGGKGSVIRLHLKTEKLKNRPSLLYTPTEKLRLVERLTWDQYFVLQDLKTNFLQGFDVIDLRIEKNSGDKFMHKYNYIVLNAGSLNLYI